MELRVNIGINQLIGFIQGLSYNEKVLIKKELDKNLTNDSLQEKEDILKVLLNGPTMTKEAYDNHKSLKKEFQKWAKKLSV